MVVVVVMDGGGREECRSNQRRAQTSIFNLSLLTAVHFIRFIFFPAVKVEITFRRRGNTKAAFLTMKIVRCTS